MRNYRRAFIRFLPVLQIVHVADQDRSSNMRLLQNTEELRKVDGGRFCSAVKIGNPLFKTDPFTGCQSESDGRKWHPNPVSQIRNHFFAFRLPVTRVSEKDFSMRTTECGPTDLVCLLFARSILFIFLYFCISSVQSQTESFVYTNTQVSLPIAVFSVPPFITNSPPDTPPVIFETITAPKGTADFHFTHWTLNGIRIDDVTGRSLNPVEIILTNNVDAVAHYLPVTNFTGDNIVPDWYKVEHYGNTINDAFSDTDSDGFNLGLEKFRNYHPRIADRLLEGGISRRRSETSLIVVNTNLVAVTARSEPGGLYERFEILTKGTTFGIPATLPIGGWDLIGWFFEGKRLDDPRGISTGTLGLKLIEPSAVILYDNTVNLSNKSIFFGNGIEFGDEIFLSGPERVVSDVTFDVFLGGTTNTNPTERVELFLRLNDGLNGAPETLLFRSGEIDLQPGWWKVSAEHLAVTVPNRFTWSVALSGIDSQTQAGLLLADPPTVGASLSDFWVKGSDGAWETQTVDNGATAGNFSVKFGAGGGVSVSGTEIEFVARFMRIEVDDDTDGLRDGYELYHFTSLANTLDSDTDGDGFTIRTELLRDYHPQVVDTLAEGGISRRRSETTLVLSDVNLVRATARSEPGGLYSDFNVLTKGESFEIPAGFGIGGWDFLGWFVGTERVDDPFGFPTGVLNFAITNDSEFVARFMRIEVDSDSDGLRDGFELFHFNSLSNNLDSDPDGDGFDIRTELLRDYHPQAVDTLEEGGVSRRRSNTTLFVPPPPEIVFQPIGTNVVEGTQVALNVEAVGIGFQEYQWRLNGVNLIGETNSIITIDPLTVANSGSYNVAVVTPFGAVNSDPAVVMVTADELPFRDLFANSQLFSDLCGKGRAVNVVSSREFAEPLHHGKASTNSVWLSWLAPTNGVVTFNTRGSSFDTIIAVYTGNDPADLQPVASDDDGDEFYTSSISFDATAEEIYRISVDGIRGAKGHILLNWCMETTSDDFPRITAQPTGRTVARGASVPFHVQVVSDNPASYQWYFNGEPVTGANDATFRVDNVTRTDVGGYQAAVWIGTRTNWSDTAVLQIGNKQKASVKKKTGDLYELPQNGGIALRSELQQWKRAVSGGSGFAPISVSVSQGDPGSHVFSSFDATTEPSEFNHGDKIWFSTDNLILRPESNGRLFVETRGDQSGIALAAYALVNNDFREAVEEGFDDDEDGRTVVDFDAAAGSDYLVIWAAKKTNTVRFETVWGLGATPAVMRDAETIVAKAGLPLSLNAWGGGVGTVSYQWRKNNTDIPGAVSSVYTIPSVQSADAGNYEVVVTASGGTTTDSIANVTVSGTSSVQGEIRYYQSSRPVSGVSIDPGDSSVSAVQSSVDGSYQFDLGVGKDYWLQPTSSDAPSAGRTVTGADISLIRRHILFISDLSSFHSVLAADVNGDLKVTTLDILLMRRYILNGISPGSTWKFVPEDQPFAFARRPSPHERRRRIRNLSSNRLGLNFVGMRAGDVNATWLATGTQSIQPNSSDSETSRLLGSTASGLPPVTLETEETPSSDGKHVRVQVVGPDFSDVTSLQFTLEWDSRFWDFGNVTGFGLRGLDRGSFGIKQINDGRLMFLWDDPEGTGVQLSDGSKVFEVNLIPVGDPSQPLKMRFSDSPVVREASIEARITQLITDTVEDTGVNQFPVKISNSGYGSGNRFGVIVETSPNKHYVLEAKEDFHQPVWTEVDRIVGDGGIRELTDSSQKLAHRFYRVREE